MAGHVIDCLSKEKLAPFRRWLGLDLALPCHVYSRFFDRGAIARSTVRYLNRLPPSRSKTQGCTCPPLHPHPPPLHSPPHCSHSILLCSPITFALIFIMPVVRHSISQDDTLYHARAEGVGKKYTTAQNFGGKNLRYSRQTLKGHRPLPRRRSYIPDDTRGAPNSEITPLLRVYNPVIA